MIYSVLYDWQKNLVNKYKDRNAYGLYLDMGLGKTPLSLAFAEQNECTKVIVITINSKAIESKDVKGSWLNWASKSDIQYKFYNKNSKDIPSEEESSLLIINYESLFVRKEEDKIAKVTIKDNVVKFLQSCEGHKVAVIIDESHKLKNLKSLQTEAIYKIKKALDQISKKTYIYLLSGTPFTVGYVDLYSQLKLLGYPDSKTSFQDKYCIRGCLPGLLGWQQPIIGYKNLDDLYDTVHKYAVTIKSEEVLDLPDKVFIEHTSKKSEEFALFTSDKYEGNKIIRFADKLALKQVFEGFNTKSKVNNPFFRNINYPDLKWLADTAGSFWLRCRQLSIGFQGNAEEAKWFDRTRLNQLRAFLKDNPDNYVLFYNYTPELIEIFNICEELEYNIDVYCGEVKSLNNYESYIKMNDSQKLNNKKNVIIANFVSGSTGMNWQEYDKCIIFSVPLYKDWEQGLKRIHRIGQKTPCSIIILSGQLVGSLNEKKFGGVHNLYPRYV